MQGYNIALFFSMGFLVVFLSILGIFLSTR
jgi:uncharacterized membrane protein YbaN (DUF454 family)